MLCDWDSEIINTQKTDSHRTYKKAHLNPATETRPNATWGQLNLQVFDPFIKYNCITCSYKHATNEREVTLLCLLFMQLVCSLCARGVNTLQKCPAEPEETKKLQLVCGLSFFTPHTHVCSTSINTSKFMYEHQWLNLKLIVIYIYVSWQKLVVWNKWIQLFST